jgi:transcriptional regulator with XRE-family HTH domain
MKPEKLIELRTALALTQHELADLTGIAQPNIAAMESGKRPIGAKSATRLTEILTKPIADIEALMRAGYSQDSIDAAVMAAFNKTHLKTLRRDHGID